MDCIKVINGLFICPYCNLPFKSLATHTRQAHNISSKQLKQIFNLPQSFSFETEGVKQKRRVDALNNGMDEQLKQSGKRTRFKKGRKLNKKQIRSISEGHKKIITINKIS